MNQTLYPDVSSLRKQFPVTERSVYLDHAAIGTLSEPVRQAMDSYLAHRATSGDKGPYEHLSDELRGALARLINGDPREVAFVQNTSEGLNVIANALPLQAGDNVVFCDMEFPSNVYPWMNLERRGVKARCVPHDGGGLTLQALEEHADDRTRVVSVSSVEFLTGFRSDLEALGTWCREHDVFFVVDGIQSVGVLPMDVRGCHIDFLSCGGPKWLMGPTGQGFIYIRDGLLDRLTPSFAGCVSVVGWEDWRTYDLTFLPDARRFELGSPNLIGQVGLLAAVELLLHTGVESIAAWTRHLTDLLIEDLQDRAYPIATNLSPKHRSAIVSFAVLNGVGAAHERLARADVVVSQRESYIRVSPHCYNTEEEIHRVGEALDAAGALR